jgi:hypothetical protein
MPHSNRCTVAIFEVQDLALAVIQSGERAVERALLRLEQSFEATLRPSAGDSVSRASGHAELIIVLHGAKTGEALHKLFGCAQAFERDTGMRVVSAHSDSDLADVSFKDVFHRADASLMREKMRIAPHGR